VDSFSALERMKMRKPSAVNLTTKQRESKVANIKEEVARAQEERARKRAERKAKKKKKKTMKKSRREKEKRIEPRDESPESAGNASDALSHSL
jgi:hypothetical protein